MTDLRVLIADDHAPTRAGVRMALEADGIEVCAEAATGAEAAAAAVRERPDCCLLDVHMPGSGTAAASAITVHLPSAVVVMLTVSRADADLFEAIRRGASGYLLKDMDPTRLGAAIRAAVRGEAVLPRTLTTRVLEELRDRPEDHRLNAPPTGGAQLTRREWDVLELLCDGAGTPEMATRLFLSPVTVRRHVSSVLAKLDVSSRAEAVRIARDGHDRGH